MLDAEPQGESQSLETINPEMAQKIVRLMNLAAFNPEMSKKVAHCISHEINAARSAMPALTILSAEEVAADVEKRERERNRMTRMGNWMQQTLRTGAYN